MVRLLGVGKPGNIGNLGADYIGRLIGMLDIIGYNMGNEIIYGNGCYLIRLELLTDWPR